MYQLEGAQRQIRRLPRDIQQKVLRAIQELSANLRPHGVLKLSGMEGYRIRVEDYRILYLIDDASQRVEVYRVMAREGVYRVR
ncbi:MAG: type II toxin-antitoxin system RelE/ParE family toxin [Chloroflexi bacterium]|nr:type II toxin-antitoxin system RelE/ParE family toxin [Chloroflexota bacterium]